jgi:hypothetical protein
MQYRILRVDNYDRDIPERFVDLPPMPLGAAEIIVRLLKTHCSSDNGSDWWKVVPANYEPKTRDL